MKIEHVRTAVEIGVSVASVLILIRVATGPDGLRRMRMRAALVGESLCMAQARGWAHMADSCRTVYDGARTVTV